MKIVNFEGENVYIFRNLRNFNEIFRKHVAYNNIKRHKRVGSHPVFRKKEFENKRGGSN